MSTLSWQINQKLILRERVKEAAFFWLNLRMQRKTRLGMFRFFYDKTLSCLQSFSKHLQSRDVLNFFYKTSERKFPLRLKLLHLVYQNVCTNCFCKHQQNLEREKNSFCRKQKDQRNKIIKLNLWTFYIVKENEEFSLTNCSYTYLESFIEYARMGESGCVGTLPAPWASSASECRHWFCNNF